MLDPVTVFRKYESLRSDFPVLIVRRQRLKLIQSWKLRSEVDVFVFDAFGVLNIGEAAYTWCRLSNKRIAEIE